MTAAGFKRLWSTPRRCSRGGLLDYPTPQQRYLRLNSYARYRRRPDAYPAGQEQLKGELGHIESFRFIQSPPLLDPLPAFTRLQLGDRAGAELLDGMTFKVAPLEVHPTAAGLALTMTAGAAQLAQISRAYQAALESGTGAILIGMDLASGPDWSVVQEWRRPDLFERYNRLPPARSLHDQERLAAAELKRARRRIKLRQLSAKGAIGRADLVQG